MRRPLPTYLNNVSTRVLVTGSRGKSTIVRMIHAAFVHAGLDCHARITGVVPRQLTPSGSQEIGRSAGAHVGEMRWWLGQLPGSTAAIVMENSAISPEFQKLAGRWLKPEITVLSNTFPDHQEVWGPDPSCSAAILMQGVPEGTRLVTPASCRSNHELMELIEQRDCQVIFAEPVTTINEPHRAINAGLALTAVHESGLSGTGVLEAITALPKDIYDFDVIHHHGTEIAMAFSANDTVSTGALYQSLQWPRDQTRLVYNHRKDRPARLKSFKPWLNHPDWRDVTIIGDRPIGSGQSARYRKVRTPEDLLDLFEPGDKVFGCGNVAGIPIALLQRIRQDSDTIVNH